MLGQLYVISAPSGAGKTSLVSRLLEIDPMIKVSVSTTTRAPRPGERDGVNYHFVDKATFEQQVAAGDFLEHAQVFDNYYGTSRSVVMQQLDAGLDVILEIDWQGAQQIRQEFTQLTSIFIAPPSLSELERRLKGRATDAPEVIAKRMSEANRELSHYHEFEYLIINDDFDSALMHLHSIFVANRQTLNYQKTKHASLLSQLIPT
ncbi:guanylate kinase [Thiomicrospira cyclica]|uniref:Guanylate kinase n=1 Tax=Thiomicrospira cyclica (strain DSM 14477 / JCM 11371 / ALM1) TaxID=717773 RepID=F6D921_THICA|nr:guanylate kinase [Thiomicrospira cyclica]AEG30852.1 Guanylate kinase [Thiomicrospira cyclica ALM1]